MQHREQDAHATCRSRSNKPIEIEQVATAPVGKKRLGGSRLGICLLSAIAQYWESQGAAMRRTQGSGPVRSAYHAIRGKSRGSRGAPQRCSPPWRRQRRQRACRRPRGAQCVSRRHLRARATLIARARASRRHASVAAGCSDPGCSLGRSPQSTCCQLSGHATHMKLYESDPPSLVPQELSVSKTGACARGSAAEPRPERCLGMSRAAQVPDVSRSTRSTTTRLERLPGFEGPCRARRFAWRDAARRTTCRTRGIHAIWGRAAPRLSAGAPRLAVGDVIEWVFISRSDAGAVRAMRVARGDAGVTSPLSNAGGRNLGSTPSSR